MFGIRKPGFTLDARRLTRISVIALIGIILLSACQSKTPVPTGVEAGGTESSRTQAANLPTVPPSKTATATAQPAPTQSEVNAYPGIQGGQYPTPIGAYPAPGSGAIPTQENIGPYPDPGDNGSYPPPTPSGQSGANADNPYPSPDANPYPGPPTSPATQLAATNQPSATPQVAATSAPTPTAPVNPTSGPSSTPLATATASLTSTSTPTPTATPIPSLRTNLLATDPATVKLVSGKPELIVFFAYWDGNSRIMMPDLLNLQDQYGTQVNFIYLDIDDPATSPLKRALYFDAYGTMPQTFLLDKDGKIIRKWLG
ncbi:MAG: hypothetical protein P8Z00_12845 [Anaerolineales bacterium]